MTNTLIGAEAWQVPRWEQEYYPDDLPEEWQLSYYANEFSTTLIDCHRYLGTESLDYLAEALEDCHDEFRPVLSVHGGKVVPQQVAEFIDFLELLDPDIGIKRLAGVYLDASSGMNSQVSLVEWRASVPASLPVAVGQHLWAEVSKDLQQQGIYPVWEPGYQPAESINHWLSFVNVASAPRELADQVQSFLHSMSESDLTACIIASKGYEDIDKLQQLVTMVRLING